MKKTNVINNIDKTHKDFLEDFKKNEDEIIPSLIQKRDELKMEIKKLKNTQVDKFMLLKDEINEITTNVKSLKKKKKDYFLKNSQHL